jgi:ERCC4-related helicase
MKKTRIAFGLLAIILMSCSQALAQKPAAKLAPLTPTPDLSKLNIESILQQLQATKVQANTEETSPLQAVAEFLQLGPEQVSELEQLLQARQAVIEPLFHTAQTLTQQLGILLNTGGNAAQVGVLAIRIHALQQQIGQAQQSFLSHFVAVLDVAQLQKLQAVQIAAQLQPILPAFQPIFLF